MGASASRSDQLDGLILAHSDGAFYCVSVSPQDFHCLAAGPSWRIARDGPRSYVVRNVTVSRGCKARQYLHRLLLGLKQGDTLEGDHVNGNGLDNRRENIRVVTHAQQGQNQRKQAATTSRYRGVIWKGRKRRWEATVWKNGVGHHFGLFRSEEAAGAAARDGRRQLFTHSNEARHPIEGSV